MNSNVVLWAATQAMWERVGPSLIRLTVGYEQKTAKISFVVSDQMGIEEEELYQDASTEFLSYFNYDSELDVKIIRLSQYDPTRDLLGVKVFARAG